MIREKSQKRSKKLAISLILLENVYDSIPLFEFLIEINLEWSLSSKGNDILSVYILKPSYYFCKQLINVLYKRKQSGFMRYFEHLFFILVISLNISFIFPLKDNKFLLIFASESGLILVCFVFFAKIMTTSKNFKYNVLNSCLNGMGESLAILEEIKTKNKAKSDRKKYKVFYANENALLALKNQKSTEKISFSDLNYGIPKLRTMENDISLKTQQMTSNEPFNNSLLPQQTFENLKEILDFYNSLNDNSLILKLAEVPKNQLEEFQKISTLQVTVKKECFWGKVYFFVKIQKMEQNLKNKRNSDYETRLLNSLSHELKTPLNGTLTLLELMKNEENCSETEIYLDSSLACLKLMENTINNIIDFSLILSDQFLICMSNVNLYSLLKEVFNITKSQIRLKNIDYSVELDGIFAKIAIYTDYSRLKQIILNITLNCIQFTNKGSIKIEVRLICRNKPTTVEIKISDTGMGMDPMFCRNLMEKLSYDEDSNFQANSTSSCMGLTISQRFALLLGNAGLQIQSKLNEGTTVSFKVIDQSFEEGITSTKHGIDHIVIKDSNQKLPHFAAILDHSKKIEVLRQKNKTLRKKESSYGSLEEMPSGGGGASGVQVSQNLSVENTMLSFNVRNHNFDALVRPQIWITSKVDKMDYLTDKSTPKRNNYNDVVFHSTIFKKNNRVPRKSEGNYVFNFHNAHDNTPELVPDNDGLSQFSQPLYLGSKSICTSEQKSSLPKENVGCQCEEVLIVDDDAFNLLSLELILKNFNVKCVKAMNGKEALDCVANKFCQSVRCRGFKLVFMDYQMPILDGVESTREILKLNGQDELRHVTVIGCTAFTEVETFLNIGPKDIIFKPLNKEIVGNILNEWLN